MALYENILVNFEVETLIKKVLGFLQTASIQLHIWAYEDDYGCPEVSR